MLPQAVGQWFRENNFGEVVSASPVGGGCINNGLRVRTRSGQAFFLKTNPQAPPEMFAREAEGLQALRVAGGPRVPRSFLHGVDFLLLEDLAPAPPVANYWEILGRQMAELHRVTSPNFGLAHDNFIGSTPQPNPQTEDGFEFFARFRLTFQAERAAGRGLLSSHHTGQVARIADRLAEWVPRQPASILHGDLWSGNLISDGSGQPAIIDPAAYFGWAEADLALMVLFGSPPGSFFRAYQAARPLEPGYRDRFPLYNLYHLLNHLNLFGMSYHSQVLAVLKRYA